MEHILDIIMIPIQVIIVFYSLYYFILACFGLMKRRERITVAPKNTFAAVICAHNEEKVVWQLIDNLKQLNYPKDMYDIYVVADNCTDHTADICREHGAIVKVRTNKGTSRQGLCPGLDVLADAGPGKAVRRFVVFDADNLVHPEFLREMNNHLCKGEKVIQGYMDSKNRRTRGLPVPFPSPSGSSTTCGIWPSTTSACRRPWAARHVHRHGNRPQVRLGL